MTLFKKLSELTRQSPLINLTLSREGQKLRLTITPKLSKPMDEDDRVEPHEAALVTPISIVGTAEELDSGLEAELDRYLTQHAALASAVSDFEQELTEGKLSVKAKTADHQRKRGVTPALAAPAATPALPDKPLAPAAAALAGK